MSSIARLLIAPLSIALAVSVVVGCGESAESIQNKGSDTMLQVAQAWAEAYPDISVEVAGGGSGVGISALINGTVDIANCSRAVKPSEIEDAKKATQKEPVEFITGYDALAVYVHKDNPIESITIAQLADVYGKDGKTTTWAQLGVEGLGNITLVGRQNSSGTYVYFREAILGKKGEFKLTTLNQSGSTDLVELVGKTAGAIGYSGMGYKTDEVKFVPVKKDDGAPAVLPSISTVNDKSYPIARPLYMYTLGQPEGATKKYLDWVRGDEAQAILEKQGYVPLPANDRIASK